MVGLRALLALVPVMAGAQHVYTYVGLVGPDRVLLAWGTAAGGGNTIGRDSTPLGPAQVRIAGRTLSSDRNWILVTALKPDQSHEYEVSAGGRRIGGGKVRTYPLKTDKLAFFVIGDYGVGPPEQDAIARAMFAQFEERRGSDNPVRFVLTTGDNIYGGFNSGRQDTDWEPKFFRPYEKLLQEIPFYPTLGNHDGNESEARADLPVYLDNFFFPTPEPARFYQFSFGGLADFFALDTTRNTLEGSRRPNYEENGAQHRWLAGALSRSTAPWKIPFFHHPPFNAGPGHGDYLSQLKHFVRLFQLNGVRVVFNGHEHNFQISAQDDRTGGICYVITGAGGALRQRDVSGRLERAGMIGWAPARHFLLVEIEGRTMKIRPMAQEPVRVLDKDRRELRTPFEVKLK